MKFLRPLLAMFLLVGAGVLPRSASAEDSLSVIVGSQAPRLERLAAEEIAAVVSRLYKKHVEIKTDDGAISGDSILLGSPQTNRHVKLVMADNWPNLSDQGHLLQSQQHGGKQLLVIGGRTPVATLWGVYEFAQTCGVRFLLSGDVDPVEPRAFSLSNFDMLREPRLKMRTWRTINDFAIGPESYGLEEHRRILKQLAKLKFNRVLLSVYPWQPFVDYSFKGVRKSTAISWYGYRYPVDANTPGRVVFGNATEHANPDLADKKTYDERIAAGKSLINGIIDCAHDLGMTVGLSMSPVEFPKEFEQILPGARTPITLENLVIGPGSGQSPRDDTLLELARTQIRAYRDAYPRLDALYLSLPEFPDWIEHSDESWANLIEGTDLSRDDLSGLIARARNRPTLASGDRGESALRGNITMLDFLRRLTADKELFARPDGSALEIQLLQIDPALYGVIDRLLPQRIPLLHLVDYTARRVVKSSLWPSGAEIRNHPQHMILTLADDNVGVLPQLPLQEIHELVEKMVHDQYAGFSTRYWLAMDTDPIVFYLSLASWREGITPKQACQELIEPICGPGVFERFWLTFESIEAAGNLIDDEQIGFAFPVPGMVSKHNQPGETPAWWTKAKDLYARASEEGYRSNDRAHLNGRRLIMHFTKRAEFAASYFSAIESMKRGATAKAAGRSDEYLTQLEAAVDQMHAAIDSQAASVLDSADKGVVAVTAELGYRPLVAELESADAQ